MFKESKNDSTPKRGLTRKVVVIGLAVLLLGVLITTYGVWTQSGFSHGNPEYDQGCYCHNSDIAVWINDTGDGFGGMFLRSVSAGSTFHILATTSSSHASGVVPGEQEWMDNSSYTGDSAFTFSPQSVTATSPQNINTTSGSITALYTVTAPKTTGAYFLQLYSMGQYLEPIGVIV